MTNMRVPSLMGILAAAMLLASCADGYGHRDHNDGGDQHHDASAGDREHHDAPPSDQDHHDDPHG